MKINLIVACDKNGGIGLKGGLPWNKHFKQDIRNFMNLTLDKAVLMGRQTWESLPEKHRPLQNRRNYVLSTTLESSGDVTVMPNLNSAIARAALDGVDELWVIGGAKLYSEIVLKRPKLLTDIWITIIDQEYCCDSFFPIKNFDEPIFSKKYVSGCGIKYSINKY